MFHTKAVEGIKTHILCFINFFFFRKSCFYEIKWKNVAEWDRTQMTIWGMRIACQITKATDTDSEHVILVTFSLQQWLQECTTMLRHTYFACLIVISHRIKKNLSISFLEPSDLADGAAAN
jgi:hypothetical protein